jgi:glutamate racemase
MTFLAKADDAVNAIQAHQAKHPSGDALWSFDASAYRGETKSLPVGVFDSGIGGLTVLDAILRIDAFQNGNLQPGADGVRDFSEERFTYFGDQANMPYGNYPAAGREDLLRELILRDAAFLLGQRYHRTSSSEPLTDKAGVKAIVIACNTATAFGLEDIRAAVKSWGLSTPVIGVVEAGARGVMELIPSDSRPDAIAVLATVGTCGCEAYPRAISRATGLAGKPMPVIIQQGSVGLAGAIEGDPAFISPTPERVAPYQGPVPDEALRSVYQFDPAGMVGDQLNSVANHVRYEVTTLVERHRKSGDDTPIGMVVLGCTHYPMAQKEIAAAFEQLRTYRAADGVQPYAALIREKLQFINPAEFTAKELFRELARAKLRLKPDARVQEADRFFLSVPNPSWPGVKLTATGALDRDYKHQRPLSDFARLDAVPVPLTPDLLPKTTAIVIETLMPEIWHRLR